MGRWGVAQGLCSGALNCSKKEACVCVHNAIVHVCVHACMCACMKGHVRSTRASGSEVVGPPLPRNLRECAV